MNVGLNRKESVKRLAGASGITHVRGFESMAVNNNTIMAKGITHVRGFESMLSGAIKWISKSITHERGFES